MRQQPAPEVRLSKHDQDHLEEAYRRYAPRLLSVIFCRLWRGRVGADTVLQSVLLSFAGRLARPNPAMSGEADIWSQLEEIATRHCNRHNKRKTRERTVLFGELEHRGATPDADEFNPSQKGVCDLRATVEGEEWVDYVLVRLSPSEREVLRFKLAGHTIEDIARDIDTTEASIKATLRRIRKVVRVCLEETDE